MYPEHKVLKETAQKRLKALQDFTELGSGYKIAQRDLMIRGAGDVLGPEQAGFIDNIGLDMYLKLLNEAVKDKLQGTITEEKPIELNLTLSVDAYIPSDYASESDKIELYQEINSACTIEQLTIVKQKIVDIYGKLPPSVELLIQKRMIDVLVKLCEIKSLMEKGHQVEIILNDVFTKIRGVGNLLFEAMIPFISFSKIVYRDHTFRITMQKRTDWFKDVKNILLALLNILETNKVIEDRREILS